MMITRKRWGQWGGMVLLAAVFLATGGCGNARTSSQTNGGSSASTVGGSSVTGDVVKVDLTTNRTKIAKGDVALVAVRITCSQISGNCPLTDSNGVPYFAAHPLTSTSTSASSIDIIANYSVSAAGWLGTTSTAVSGSQTFTLAAGTPAVYTNGVLTTSAILGGTSSAINFTVNITGALEGVAILTVQVYNTVASIAIDVTGNTSGILK